MSVVVKLAIESYTKELAQYLTHIPILLSGKFKENRIFRFEIIDCVPKNSLIFRYFLVFQVISRLWHIEIHPNFHIMPSLYPPYYLESLKKIAYSDFEIIDRILKN